MSAIRTLPHITKTFPEIKTAIDVNLVGWGGVWLKALKEIKQDIEILGLQPENQRIDKLLIDSNFIKKLDIETCSFKDIGRQFDIALSLNFLNKRDETKNKAHLKFLTQLSDIVLFSANNLRIDPGYWNFLFIQNGYECYDILRQKIWADPWVSDNFKQSIVLYVKETKREYLSQKGIFPQRVPSAFFTFNTVGTLLKKVSNAGKSKENENNERLHKYRKRYQRLVVVLSLLTALLCVLFII
jgi:hypothetical protein